MMQLTTGTATRCSGGGHYQLPVTIGGVERTLHFTREDLERDFNDMEGAREAILDRLRSAITLAGSAAKNEHAKKTTARKRRMESILSVSVGWK